MCGALLVLLLALPATASADHNIAAAVRASGQPLPSGTGTQAASGDLVSDLRTTPGSLEQVGHSPLLNRGMNAALAVKGNYAYVGSRTDGTHVDAGVLVVDVSNPAAPTVVNQIGPPLEGNPGETSRELRIWPQQNLLLVLNHGCSELIHRCVGGQAVRSTIRFYDISGANAANPQLVSTFLPSRTRPQIPHEFFLWVDPEDPARALMYYTNPSPDDQELIVTDISGARQGDFDEVAEFKVKLPDNGRDNRLHSLGISNDGTRAYLAYLGGGFLVADTSDFAAPGVANPQVRLITPVKQRVFWTDPGAHSAVKLFGRPFALTTDEVYGKLGGALPAHGCPWGWARTIDIANERKPKVIGSYRVAPYNFASYCDQVPPDQENLSSQSSHNPTLTPNVALITWHSRGFQLFSIENPAKPRALGEFMPEPLPAVQTEDPALSSGRDKVVMWSYPIVKDGLIYLVDLRNGLYILRYTGPCQEEITPVSFLEGNSNLGDALRFEASATTRSYAGKCAPFSGAPTTTAAPSQSAGGVFAFPSGGFGGGELRRD